MRLAIGALGVVAVFAAGCTAGRPPAEDATARAELVSNREARSQAEAAPAPVRTTAADVPLATPPRVTAEVEETVGVTNQPEPTAAANGVAGFNREAASKVILAGLERAKACRTAEGPTGKGRVVLTFAVDGSVTGVDLDETFRDTDVGRCITSELENMFIDPFASATGGPITVGKSFEIPSE